MTGSEELWVNLQEKSLYKVSSTVYCLPLFGGCNSCELDALQQLQNRAARIALNLPQMSNRKSMYVELEWLTVRQLIVYHTLILVFRVRQSGAPSALARQLLSENYRGNIIVKNSHLELYKRSFVPRGATLWNKLPLGVKMMKNIGIFKKHLKDWVMNNVKMMED